MKASFDQAFRAMEYDGRFFVLAEVGEKTGRRAAALLSDGEKPEDLARVVGDALDLHALPTLIARAKL